MIRAAWVRFRDWVANHPLTTILFNIIREDR